MLELADAVYVVIGKMFVWLSVMTDCFFGLCRGGVLDVFCV